ncbi:MAG: hypothetical protein Q8N51_20630, partial [Gammaproteobacteria bacterium]|nr:hypothetical protein [Gammaproteobacteria bacterium]
ITEFTYAAACGLMTRFRSWDSTDPLYSLESELVLEQLPDLTVPPRLTIRRQGNQVVLACPGVPDFTLECSEDGGRTWRALGSMRAEWEIDVDPARPCRWYRLRR